jgi:hypothetical protein
MSIRQLFTIAVTCPTLVNTFGDITSRIINNPKRRKIHHGQEKSCQEGRQEEAVEGEVQEKEVIVSRSQ